MPIYWHYFTCSNWCRHFIERCRFNHADICWAITPKNSVEFVQLFADTLCNTTRYRTTFNPAIEVASFCCFATFHFLVMSTFIRRFVSPRNLVMTFGLTLGLTFAGTFDRMSFSCTVRVIFGWLVDACPKSLFWRAATFEILCLGYSTHTHY